MNPPCKAGMGPVHEPVHDLPIMKIIAISTARIPSDTANSIQVMKACQAMQQIGHEVELLVPGANPSPWDLLAERYGLTTPFGVTWLPARSSLRRYDFSWKAARLANRKKFEILYTWPVQAAVFGRSLNLPVVLDLHGPPAGRLGPRLFRSFLRHGERRRVCPITKALLEILERRYGSRLDPDQVVIAPNGVELERYTGLPAPSEARGQLGISGDPVAGYTGHLYPGRGMGLLLELAKRHPQVQFVWIGGREGDVAYWTSRLEREEVRNIRITGFIDNRRLPLYQAAMDFLLMPYEKVIEGSGGGNSADYCSPMKMFEYMATGRAIISSDLTPLREVLDEEIAVLCPPEDPDAWSHALTALLSDPDRARLLGESARLRAQAYTWTGRQKRILEGL